MNIMLRGISLPDIQPLFLILLFKFSHVQKDTLLPSTKFKQEALNVHVLVCSRVWSKYGSVVRVYTVGSLQVQYRTIPVLHINILQFVNM